MNPLRTADRQSKIRQSAIEKIENPKSEIEKIACLLH
jgi:hypothetical protein